MKLFYISLINLIIEILIIEINDKNNKISF